MFKKYCMLLLLAHIIGDFYVQTDCMAQKKKKCFKWVLIHCLCYFAVVLAASIPIMSKQVAIFGSISAVVHMSIDISKYFYVLSKTKKRHLSPRTERNLFFADQSLHLLSIAFIAYVFVGQGNILQAHSDITKFMQTIGGSASSLLAWAVVLFAIHKPVNIAISMQLALYKPINVAATEPYIFYKLGRSEEQNKKDKKAGRLIGTLERVIILILISLNQYSVIGLVLTAKSIARYDKIAKDPSFSEYYLIGTLLSTLAAITISSIL